MSRRVMVSNRRKASRVFNYIFRFFGTFTAFLLQFVVATYLGASQSGIFVLVLSITLVASTIARFGLDLGITKLIAGYEAVLDSSDTVSIFGLSIRIALVIGLVCSVFLHLSSDWLAIRFFEKPEVGAVLRIMCWCIAPHAIIIIFAHSLQGLGRIAESLSYQVVLVPVISALLMVFFIPSFGLVGAAYSYLGGVLLIFILCLTRSRLIFEGWTLRRSRHTASDVSKICIPILFSSLAQQLLQQAPVFALGYMASSSAVGIFGVSQRVAIVVSIAVVAANVFVAPKVSGFYKRGEHKKMRHTAKNGTLLSLAVGLPIVGTILVFSKEILSIFGDEFAASSLILIVLICGQITNLISGSCSIVLLMTNRQKTHMVINLLSLLTCVIALAVLVPSYAGVGAAVAISISMLLANVLRILSVRKYLYRQEIIT